MKGLGRSGQVAALGCVFVAAFLIRLWLIHNRWVGPDEGAHLMDGQLILNGLIPNVDFDSRQVLYAYLTSAAVRLLGTDLFVLRLFPVAVTLASGGVVYLIGRHLAGWRAGVLAAGLFLLLPFSALHTIQTKTEPLAILTSAGAVYWFVRAYSGTGRRTTLLLAAGLCCGAAFYIRQSTLAIPAALFLLVAFEELPRWGQLVRSTAALALGMASVTVVVSLYYLRVMPLADVVSGGVSNPIGFVIDNLGGLAGGAPDPSGEGFGRADRLELQTSARNATRAMLTSVVLLVGTALAVIAGASAWARTRTKSSLRAYAVPFVWLVLTSLAYAFWTVKRGFYPAYFLELTPALALLSAAGFLACWRLLPDPRGRRACLWAMPALIALLAAGSMIDGVPGPGRPLVFVLTALGLGLVYGVAVDRGADAPVVRPWGSTAAGVAVVVAVAAVGRLAPGPIELAIGLVGVVAVLGLIRRFSPALRIRRGRPELGLAGVVLFVAGAALSLSESATRLSLDYHAVWTPQTVRAVSDYLEDESDPDGTVLSGAVIWEFQARRAPFAGVSHPLSLIGGIPESDVRRLRQALDTTPPAVILLDGYAERTYGTVVPDLERRVEQGYRLVETFPGPKEDVRVYVPRIHRAAPGG